MVQKLRVALTPDKGYTRDKVKAVLMQEGFSDSAAELKMLDLERAKIICIDDAGTVFLRKREDDELAKGAVAVLNGTSGRREP